MADHDGGWRSVVNPGTKCGARPSKSPSFGARGAVLAPVFCKTKIDYIDQEAGGIVWNKCFWKWFKLLFDFILIFIFVWFAKNALWAPKLSYFNGCAPNLGARINHRTPAAGVISHILYIHIYIPATWSIRLSGKKSKERWVFITRLKWKKTHLIINTL